MNTQETWWQLGVLTCLFYKANVFRVVHQLKSRGKKLKNITHISFRDYKITVTTASLEVLRLSFNELKK